MNSGHRSGTFLFASRGCKSVPVSRVRTCSPIAGYVILLILLLSNQTLAQDSSSAKRVVPEIRAFRVNPTAPVIDGGLDDPVWSDPGIQFARDFTQREPDDGKAATESTLVAVAYDEKAIYFAFWCYDSEPGRIARQMVRRDRGSESDQVFVRLVPYHDHQSGFHFNVNAAGSQGDERLFDEYHSDDAWDGVWSSAVRLQPWGWSAEMRIPYHCLRFNKKEDHIWGVDFARYVSRKDEGSRWAWTPTGEGGFVSNLGHLTGLSGITPARHFELLPYMVTDLETEQRSAGNPDGRGYRGNIGLDLKYGLSSNLTLDAAINPDFGQVELDRPVLNLSTFETYYSERRPFFVEGADLFESEYELFYSRRVGRAPTDEIDDDEHIYDIHFPKATTILGAAKLTGRLSSGTSIAFLNAVTDEEVAEYAAQVVTEADSTWAGDTLSVDTVSADTVSRSAVVEPRSNYSIIRIKQDVLSNSSIGWMLTLASQDARYPAVTGGFDWRLHTNDGAWCFRGQSVFSRVDNEHVGFGTDMIIEKEAGRHIRGAAGIVIKDPHLHINRLGFTSRNDVRHFWSWAQYRSSDDWWIVRNSWNNVNCFFSWNYNGDNITRGWNFNNCIQFVNNWYGGMGIVQDHQEYDDLETRGHGLWKWPRTWNGWIWVDTDERRKFSVEVDFGFGNSRTSPWWSSELLLRYRPASNMEFSVHGRFVHDFGQLKWVDNPDDTTTIFADKDQDLFEVNAAASVMFHRNLSCQLSAQGLISGLDYHNYRPYLGHGRYGDHQTGYDHDYNYAVLNSTLLVRWEYCPGSTLYVVWTRARSETDESVNDLDFSRDFSRLFSGGGNNVFLVKASYWLNI